MIQEFKLQDGLHSAEFGMGAGEVNVALKSGANQFPGSGWNLLRNEALQPRNLRLAAKTPLKQNQFGFTFGDPVWMPKAYRG